MKRLILLLMTVSLLSSCSSKKHIQRALYSGNYDHAITDALKKINPRKDSKRSMKFALLLEEAYAKAVARDFETIEKLKKSNSPDHLRIVFDIYVNIDARQEAIKPILPLRVGNRLIKIKMYDVTDELLASRDRLVTYTYGYAKSLLNSGLKYDARAAYAKLAYIEQIHPNYEDVRALMQEAYHLGTDYVLVDVVNESFQILPLHLEQDLLSFDTYGLDNFWTKYHAEASPGFNYAGQMKIALRQINISPEQLIQTQHLRQKEVVDGWEYLLDENGNVVQDSLGNDIKVDRYINVRARVFETEQFKAAKVLARVEYLNFETNTLLDAFSLDSEIIFRNRYARMRGDERALTPYDLDLLNNRILPFPSNSQMVSDTGTDLKYKLKAIMNDYRFTG